jgi:hypothetical protein
MGKRTAQDFQPVRPRFCRRRSLVFRPLGRSIHRLGTFGTPAPPNLWERIPRTPVALSDPARDGCTRIRSKTKSLQQQSTEKA